MKKVLITGFNAFGRNQTNPTEEVVKAYRTDKALVHKALLPTVYSKAQQQLDDLLSSESYDLVIMLGFSKSTKNLKIETVARNRCSNIAKDNEGKIGPKVIDVSQPELLNSTFDLHKLTNQLDVAGVTYILSVNAGGYLCNFAYFHMLKYFANNQKIPCFFVHLNSSEKAKEDIGRLLDMAIND